MRVTLIAKTEMQGLPESISETRFANVVRSNDLAWNFEDLPNDADTLAHFAGRSCYQAWDMPRPETSNDMGYLANIIKQGHFSVLEHGSATFYIEGVSRNLTHELIRHRHLSYSELSQRYVDMSTAKQVIPPAMSPTYQRLTNDGRRDYTIDVASKDMELYNATVDGLIEQGYTRKQAREAARFYLPSGMETKIVVTGNHRAWRDMLQKRYSVHADAEIRELATELLYQLKSIAPGCYQDFPEEPFA